MDKPATNVWAFTLLASISAGGGQACGATTRVVHPVAESKCDEGGSGLVVHTVDASGMFLPGLEVTVWPNRGEKSRAQSDGGGIASFRLPQGTQVCRVRVTGAGFETTVVEQMACGGGCLSSLTLPVHVDMGKPVTIEEPAAATTTPH